jgi:hypothetical protein
MKSGFHIVLGCLIGLMAVSDIFSTKEAMAADPVRLEVYDPTGATEVTELHAPRLKTLAGKTICELWNDSWEGDRTKPSSKCSRHPTKR